MSAPRVRSTTTTPARLQPSLLCAGPCLSADRSRRGWQTGRAAARPPTPGATRPPTSAAFPAS
eukprot:2554226-Prymnesium_polylepis.1